MKNNYFKIILLISIFSICISGCGNVDNESKSDENLSDVEVTTETETIVLTNREKADLYAAAILNKTYYMEGERHYVDIGNNYIVTHDSFQEGYNGDDFIWTGFNSGTNLILEGVFYSSEGTGDLVEVSEGDFFSGHMQEVVFSDEGTAPFEGFETIDSTQYEYYAYEGGYFVDTSLMGAYQSINDRIIFYFKDDSLYAIKWDFLYIVDLFVTENLDQYIKFPG